MRRVVRAPEFPEEVRWLNSKPLALREHRGKCVLVDFWEYTCVNCVHTLPYVVEWDRKYREHGLTTIGVHAPEFQFAREARQVERAMEEFGVAYPVVMDNAYEIWQAFSNHLRKRIPAYNLSASVSIPITIHPKCSQIMLNNTVPILKRGHSLPDLFRRYTLLPKTGLNSLLIPQMLIQARLTKIPAPRHARCVFTRFGCSPYPSSRRNQGCNRATDYRRIAAELRPASSWNPR